MDAAFPAHNIVTQSNQIEQTIEPGATFATLCGRFAALAVLIAAWVYRTMSYSVARRTNETGSAWLSVRGGDAWWLVLREVLAMAADGLCIGLAAAVAASRALEEPDVSGEPNGRVRTGAAGLALLAAALVAVTGRRGGGGVDPWRALRDESRGGGPGL